jgi:carboxyl-terminal processing protease
MIKLKFLSILTFLFLVSNVQAFSLFGSDDEDDKKEKVGTKQQSKKKSVLGSLVPSRASYSREAILGKILQGSLENMHYSKKEINDDLSKNAYKEFLKRMDYGKQFYLKSDVSKLKMYEDKFDDNMKSGNMEVLTKAYSLLSVRLKMIESYVKTLLKNPFDFSKKESFETDEKKRDYAKSESALKARWRKLLKLNVLSRYSDMLDEENGVDKDKDKDKKKKKKKKKKVVVKKRTDKAREKEAREKVAKSYSKIFKRLTSEKVSDKLDKFYNSITKVFDPHTLYLPPAEKEDFDIDMTGKLEGIGALLREEGAYIKVERIIPGSASWKGKELEAEDLILKVAQAEKEPIDVVDTPLRDAVKLIRGKKGSEVRLTVKKANGLVKVISIIRDVVVIEESYVKHSLIKVKGDKRKFGYIFIPKFYRDFSDRNGRNCTDDTRKSIRALKAKNVDAIILDLRNNGGGALEDARLISGLFYDKGPVVQVKDHRGKIEVLSDYDGKIEFDKPVIVLINRFSASASEIVAAALQDYKRAIIVGGEQSHGKGTVQAVVGLDEYLSPIVRSDKKLGALKITIQQFYRVNGSSTQYKGVVPDIILPDQYAYIESGERFLDYSLPWQKIKEVPHKIWNKFSYKMSTLNKKSKQRVSKSKKFAKINKAIDWFKERKDETKRSLNLKSYLSLRKQLREKSDKLKIEQVNKNITIESGKKLKTEDEKERFDEYRETLQKDPYIEESINILNDVLS